MKFPLTILIFGFLIAGCSNSVDIERYFSPLGIELAEDYQELRNESSVAIGGQLVDIELKLGPEAFEKVVRQIEEHEDFIEISPQEPYPSGFASNPWDEPQEFAVKRGQTYFRHLYIPDSRRGGWETYTLYLQPDSVLDFQYVDE